MRVEEIMSRDVKAIAPETAADEAWERMKLHRFHHLVVKDDGAIMGVISERDLGGSRGAALRRNRTVRDLMTETAVTAPPTMTVKQAANIMRGRSVGCLPVVDRRKLVGIVTVTDMLELLGRGGTPAGNAHNLSPKQQRREARTPRVSARVARRR